MKESVLRLLKKGYPGFVSGEAICRSLGVSRTAVWKHIRALREAGYGIEAQPHAGYRLINIPDRLYAEEIAAGLPTGLIGCRIYHYTSLVSTNRTARELAGREAPDGTLVVAEEQTGGRGRLGRGWYSPCGKGIWCSVILHPPVNPVDAPPLTMLAAVAVCSALRRAAGVEAGIKWPNDLLVNGKKICGILTELSAEMERINFLITGMGINLNLTAADLPAELRTTATSVLIETGRPVSRVAVLQAVLTELEHWYLLWLQDGFAPVLARWKEFSVTLGRPVRVASLKESWTGLAEDVDENGALLLRLPAGELKKVVSGEVSLRPQ
ncbi:biotin--[acetyl-CoA-carboxylase] ligase [Desulfotomaculum copahuensis]|uniref:Bifunctional ligase/repressor BirA n=1 Tax=Desulfotomaculum copahuensis TaxID=1838280 RepID=A0A1B7LCN8_9FIRM|nr:biotin--[acetyl-CoA-carboxylase] ligase [Desulfotomaculum copahuensis]OAT80700.1 biotin--[acetyl-CoA-carboxylase] ligase [Desulfotomaculum copahuensis]